MERKITLSEKRRDKKKRILCNGESQRKDGRYAYKYMDNSGKAHFVYSWKLEKTDKLPNGKRDCESLREMEKRIQRDLMDGINPVNDKTTVLQLVEKYTGQKQGMKRNTQNVYSSTINRLKTDPFGQRRITKVKESEAKDWCLKLQNSGLTIGSVGVIKGIVRPAFQMAVNDDVLRKNPFVFTLSEYLRKDSTEKPSLTKEQEDAFLDFVKNDKKFCKWYDFICILFNTGMRVSELCGLTLEDIDLDKRVIDINHQLLYSAKLGLYIANTKTDSGHRKLPMSQSTYECFARTIQNRKPNPEDFTVDGVTGFVFLNRSGRPTYNIRWNGHFRKICDKYNDSNPTVKLPKVTPHVCRHTYCTRMIKNGVKPKTLQYLMGHSDISITLRTYTHVTADDAFDEAEILAAAF
ncbi:MAG: site-specific integrase [Clostridiales bacterium]|nr:site-specific integrase [Clostridiales bacterium]